MSTINQFVSSSLIRSAVLALAGAGCATGASEAEEGGNGPSKADDPQEVRWCADQATGNNADGEPVVFCDRLFETAPLVRMPPDAVSAGAGTRFGALHFDDHYAH